MKSSNRSKTLIVVSVLLFPCLFWLLLIQGKNHFKSLEIYGPKDVNEKGDTVYHTIPSFSFVNQEGKVISEKDVAGKIFVANFFFATCPKVCPKMNENMRGVVEKNKDFDNVRFLSFTVNPEADSVSVLAAYAKKYNADAKQWWFLTGNKDSIYTLAREGFLVAAAGGKTAADFFHSQNLILIDQQKRIRGYYDGLDNADIRKLTDEIQLLIYEEKESEKK